MNAPIHFTDSFDPAQSAAVRAHLIERRLIVPSESQRPRHFTPHIAIDSAGIDSVALELCSAHGLEAARRIALEPGTDSRLSAALLVLLTLSPGGLKDRLARHRARARRDERALEADR